MKRRKRANKLQIKTRLENPVVKTRVPTRTTRVNNLETVAEVTKPTTAKKPSVAKKTTTKKATTTKKTTAKTTAKKTTTKKATTTKKEPTDKS